MCVTGLSRGKFQGLNIHGYVTKNKNAPMTFNVVISKGVFAHGNTANHKVDKGLIRAFLSEKHIKKNNTVRSVVMAGFRTIQYE